METSSWRVLCWLSAGLGAVCLALLWTVVPDSSVRAPGRFDVLGTIGLAAGLVCLLLAITKGATWSWGSATTLSLFGAAVVVLVVWGPPAARPPPLVDLRVSARRPVLFTNLASVLVGFSMYSMSLVLPAVAAGTRDHGLRPRSVDGRRGSVDGAGRAGDDGAVAGVRRDHAQAAGRARR